MTATRQADFAQLLPEVRSIPRDNLDIAIRHQERLLDADNSIRYQLGLLTSADLDRVFGWLNQI